MYIDSPNISGSLNITGSLLLNGTAVTASGGGGGSGAGFPFSGSAVITGSLYVSGGNLSGSFAGDGAGLTGLTINQFSTFEDTFTNAPSHSAVHNFGTKNVFVQVFESDDTLIIPQSVTTSTENRVDIVFGDDISGRVVIGKAGHLLQDTGNFASSSTAVQTFTNVLTASIDHHLDSLNVITQVFDTNNNVIVPSNIKVQDSNTVKLTFASQRSGKAVIAKAGHIVQGTSENAVSASLATTAERVRAGSSGSRPTDYANISTGSLWYNTNTLALEAFTGVSGSWWQSIGSASISSRFSPYDIEYFTAAGGGGAGSRHSGGGGAGGYKTGSLNVLTGGTVYTLTVGAGGAGGVGASENEANGSNGDDSTISYSSTITALGGGHGATYFNAGSGGTSGNGGSGGGQPYGSGGSAGSGTTGQGNAGGNNGLAISRVFGGGGGGATATGGNSTTSNAGHGGAGILSSIDGYNYCGGGGGSCWDFNGGVGGNGGTGGGGGGGSAYDGSTNHNPGSGDTTGRNNGGDGNKANSNGNATGGNGGVNTGGGAGGSGQGSYSTNTYTDTAASGGSGIVILKLPTANYTGTTTGSPTVTTDGFYTILAFTQSGTYTA